MIYCILLHMKMEFCMSMMLIVIYLFILNLKNNNNICNILNGYAKRSTNSNIIGTQKYYVIRVNNRFRLITVTIQSELFLFLTNLLLILYYYYHIIFDAEINKYN